MRPPQFAVEYIRTIKGESAQDNASMRPPQFAVEYGRNRGAFPARPDRFNEATAVRGGIPGGVLVETNTMPGFNEATAVRGGIPKTNRLPPGMRIASMRPPQFAVEYR